MEIAAIARSASLERVALSKSLTVAFITNSDLALSWPLISCQSSMLKPVSAWFSSKTKGLIIRVATRNFWSVGWESATVGARQMNKIAMRPIVKTTTLADRIVDSRVGKGQCTWSEQLTVGSKINDGLLNRRS